jgi:transcriptional adapter 3
MFITGFTLAHKLLNLKLTMPGAVAPPSPPVEPGGLPVDLMDTGASPSDSGHSGEDNQPKLPLYKRAFGDDPSIVYDPTVYDIRPIVEGMTDAELKDIYNVAKWPESDLHDLTAGDPPDMDFSNAKPANQVNYSTFQTYLEPYIRPFSEEDVAFLKERGDRVTPYIIPQRGTRTYKEVWAAEDGLTGTEAPRKEEADPNAARGGMEDMNDEIAETDEISMGPIMNRLLSIIRPQPNVTMNNNRSTDDGVADAQGDTTMSNTDNPDSQTLDAIPGAASTAEEQRPITALPPDAPRPTNLPPADFDSFEARAIQELKYIGFLAPTDTPDFSQQLDDEVAARLRTLQAELRIVAARNNARKARILELTEERMAMQEYANIADDLDNQVNAAYLKRNRSLAKPSNKKGGGHAQRAGQKGVAVGGRGVSEGVKALMQKRKDWIEMVGPVVGFGRPAIPGDDETVFDEESMRRLERAEKEAEAGDVDGEL